MSNRRILLLDPARDDRALAAHLLRTSPEAFAVDEAADALAFVEKLSRGELDALVCEQHLGWSDGLTALEAFKSLYPRRPVVLFTAELPAAAVAEAFRLGLDRFVPKDSAGYLALSGVVVEALERAAGDRPPNPSNAEPRHNPGLPANPDPPFTVELPSEAELEELAHVVSHDLQAPLSLMTRFSRLLAQRCGTGLGEEGSAYLRHVVDNAERMQRMLDDILEYSRSGAVDQTFQPVDLGSVVDEAMANLGALVEESQAKVTRGRLPRVNADRAQMVQLFQNLIGNGIKFHGHGDEPPRVQVSAREDGDAWRVTVTDNGIGIAPQHHQRIFKLFQRAHPDSEFPGSGVGLAICKRIVERHDGVIDLESAPCRGSTFSVRLPKAKQSEV